MDKEDVVHTHTHTNTHTGITFSHEEEGNPTVCNNINGLRGNYGKSNNPDRER